VGRDKLPSTCMGLKIGGVTDVLHLQAEWDAFSGQRTVHCSTLGHPSIAMVRLVGVLDSVGHAK